jgi:hypothetical protein
MDGSGEENGSSDSRNGDPRNQNDPSRNFAYANRMRDRVESFSREARAMKTRIQPFIPEAQEQTVRLWGNRTVPLYAMVSGWTQRAVVSHSAQLNAALASMNGQPLNDSQAEAVIDGVYGRARIAGLLRWAVFTAPLGLAYKNRNSMSIKRFQSLFWRPFWPAINFAVYSIPVYLLIEPVFQIFGTMYYAKKFREDPRLQGFLVDLNQVRWDSQDNENQTFSQGQVTSIPQQAAPAWSDYKQNQAQPSPVPRSTQEQPSGWDASPIDDDDDASPMAPSARRAQASNASAGGSTWDRIRQQSSAPSSQSSSYQQQDRPRPASESQVPWGEPQPDASKDRAQREFDALLDRERRGVGDNSSPWSRK